MQSATHKGLQGSSGFNPQTLALRCTDSLEWQSCLTFHRPTSGREQRYETLQERQAYIIEMGGSGDLPEAEELQRPWRERPNDAHFPLLVTLREAGSGQRSVSLCIWYKSRTGIWFQGSLRNEDAGTRPARLERARVKATATLSDYSPRRVLICPMVSCKVQRWTLQRSGTRPNTCMT